MRLDLRTKKRMKSIAHQLEILKGAKRSSEGRACDAPRKRPQPQSKDLGNELNHDETKGAHLDTTTGTPASGTAPLHKPPCRRPALRQSFSPLVVVSRCAQTKADVVRH